MSYRGANQGREELKGWYQNKTDGGKVTRTSTDDELPEKPKNTYWRGWYGYGYKLGYSKALDEAKDLMYHVYGLPPDSSTWDGLGKRGHDE